MGSTILMVGTLNAATEADKRLAIDNGLEWLAHTQQANGHWNNGDVYEDTAATAAALLAFLEEGHQAGDNVTINGTSYGDVVGDALNYIFSQGQVLGIGMQPHGDPDSNGNHHGVKFVLGGTNNRDTYVTGLVLPALASTGTPNAVVNTGGASSLDGMTYKQVVQDTVDYFAFGQNDGGSGRGGWRYYANSGISDNSTAQWPAMGMLFAEGNMGATIPGFVKTELDIWNNYIQYRNYTGTGIDGSSGYDRPTYLNNVSKTGGLLVEQVLAGDPANDPDVLAAIGYLDRQWQTYASGWNGNLGHPYAMWGVYKGLESTIGLDDPNGLMTNIRPQGAAVIDPGDTWTWWEDYCEYLVSTQNTQSVGANWPSYSYWGSPLATAWNINILNATQIPHQTPDGGSTLILLLGSLIGVSGARRWRRCFRR